MHSGYVLVLVRLGIPGQSYLAVCGNGNALGRWGVSALCSLEPPLLPTHTHPPSHGLSSARLSIRKLKITSTQSARERAILHT
ncbi:hypothetical protein B0T22DRAFT_218189 [Podospora appendiculata]|uniref:Uncharacterized protein n=1 Tax=Podospora appendiculata TaxID=314037 RepID=A0AAE1CAB2_9PEZI|nr:hypothetical protein B0T22DRAFT_195422 [Podospora appendiculata]KAK3685444.1 hypothetical protein B0T22DRAFT_218189 [Podospora appendiculata]